MWGSGGTGETEVAGYIYRYTYLWLLTYWYAFLCLNPLIALHLRVVGSGKPGVHLATICPSQRLYAVPFSSGSTGYCLRHQYGAVVLATPTCLIGLHGEESYSSSLNTTTFLHGEDLWTRILWHCSTYWVRTAGHFARFTPDSDFFSPHILYSTYSAHFTLVVNPLLTTIVHHIFSSVLAEPHNKKKPPARDAANICIGDLLNHYGTNQQIACQSPCKYIHYKDTPHDMIKQSILQRFQGQQSP